MANTLDQLITQMITHNDTRPSMSYEICLFVWLLKWANNTLASQCLIQRIVLIIDQNDEYHQAF